MAAKFICVDVESDGPYPGDYSMVCFGAVALTKDLKDTFYGTTKPISDIYKPDALAVSGFTREDHLEFDDPKETMERFKEWLKVVCNGKSPVFIADNPAYDFAFINYYFHKYTGGNPFGWSGRRISDIYCGYTNDMYAKWKHLRVTNHDHNPLSDALGNAEALIKMQEMGLKLNIK